MQIMQIKKSLFTSDTALPPTRITRNAVLTRLDTKVYDSALKTIGRAALTIAVGAAVVACVSSGWGALPIVLVIAMVGIGAVCFYVRSHFKRYHNPQLLERYQSEAQLIYRRLSYLDQMEFLQGRNDQEQREIKKQLLRPITSLLNIHQSLDTLLRYNILSPVEFKKAFDLEVKYLELPEAFALYEQVRKAAKRVPDYDISLFTNHEAQEEWKRKIRSYAAEKNAAVFTGNGSNICDPWGARFLALDQMRYLIRAYFIYGIFTVERDMFEQKDADLQRAGLHKQYERLIRACPEINKEKELAQLKERHYQSDSLHDTIRQGQQQVLANIADVQQEHEKKEEELKAVYERKFAAIRSRTPYLAEDEKQMQFFERQWRLAQEGLKSQFSERVAFIMNTRIPDDSMEILERLAAHKDALEHIYAKTVARDLQGVIKMFKRSCEDPKHEMQDNQRKCSAYYTACMEVIAHNTD